MENSMEAPQKIKNKLPYDPAIPLLGNYPQNLKVLIYKYVCAPTFIVPLVTNCQHMETT